MVKPEKCPRCGSDDIGELDNIFIPMLNDKGRPITEEALQREYERSGGRWYCVICGWMSGRAL